MLGFAQIFGNIWVIQLFLEFAVALLGLLEFSVGDALLLEALVLLRRWQRYLRVLSLWIYRLQRLEWLHAILGKRSLWRKRDRVVLGDRSLMLAREGTRWQRSYFRDQNLIFDIFRVLDFVSDTRHFLLKLLLLVYCLTQLIKSLRKLLLVHQFL